MQAVGFCLSAEDCLSYLDSRESGGAPPGVVQRHLDQCPSCRVLMAEAARTFCGEERAAASRGAIRTLGSGERLEGRYEVRRFIARGGMGEVYEAFDLMLGETVALKTLTLDSVEESMAAERLLGEVRLARRVTHPNVCRILELGIHRRVGSEHEPIPFLTMELLQGETLGRRLARLGRLTPAEALPILRDVGAGLAAVHRAAVIHRDLKTDNVFLVHASVPQDDQHGDVAASDRAVVMDFGLARALKPLGTRGGSSGAGVVGTMQYMAPEQIEGRAATPVSDVYAFGVIAFEILTGQLPFRGASSSPLAEAASRLVSRAPRPSSIEPALGTVWDDVIGRCLQRDPRHRFASIEDVVRALAPLDQSMPLRRRVGRLFVAGLATSAAMAVLLTIVQSRDAGETPPAAIPPLRVATPSPAVASPAPAPRLSSRALATEVTARAAERAPPRRRRTALDVRRVSPPKMSFSTSAEPRQIFGDGEDDPIDAFANPR